MASRLSPAATRTGSASMPSSCRTQKWRRALLACFAWIRHNVNSRKRALYMLRAFPALLSASCRFLISLSNLLAYSLAYFLRILSSISASLARISLISAVFSRSASSKPSLGGAAEARRAAVAPMTKRSGGIGVGHFTESAAESGSALSPPLRLQLVGAPHGGAQRRWE